MEKNNIGRLKDEADIQSVVSYLGLEVTRRGSAFFILCPLPQHEDHNPTNCFFKSGDHALYCNTCCQSINAIDLIIYSTGCSYGEACDILWEIEGKPDWYYAKKKRKKKGQIDVPVISQEELKMIGVINPSHMYLPKKIVQDKRSIEKGYAAYPGEFSDEPGDQFNYLSCEYQRVSWRDLLSDKEYVELIRTKAYEIILKYKEMIRGNDKNDLFVQAVIENIAVCKGVFDRFTPVYLAYRK